MDRTRARVLTQPTPSGDFREVRFDAIGRCSWFLFQPWDEDDWVGVFGRGGSTREAVALSQSVDAFVIAGGRGYLINTNDKSLVHRTEREFFVDALFLPDRNLFVVADDLYLYGYNANGEQWRTHRISWDGIRNLAVDGPNVKGQAWGLDTWHDFTFHPSSGVVAGATYNGPDAKYA
jgi:hypothetical protein